MSAEAGSAAASLMAWWPELLAIDFPCELLLVLFLVAVVAGFIDSAAGGGGLIIIPALILTGMTPVQALGTNKFQACFGSFTAAAYFVRQGAVNPAQLVVMIAVVAVAAASGAMAVQLLDAAVLMKLMPAVFIGIALYSLFSKKLGAQVTAERIGERPFSASAAPAIGFYDGFFGPGTGTFFALSLVKLRGMDFVTATAHAKVLNFTSNIAALLVFSVTGQIVLLAAAIMAAGQTVGAMIGARAVVFGGANYVRLLTVVMSVAISLSLIVRG